jgi:hypothetical protein
VRTGTLPSGAMAIHGSYPSPIMYSMNAWESSALAPAVTVQEVISPNCAGSEESGPAIEVTTPVLAARKAGSAAHSGHDGFASSRRPASSSSTKLDQMNMAASPAK